MRARLAVLALLLVLPILLSGGSLPHLHHRDGGHDGLFNHEHDLTLLASLGTAASLDALVPAVVVVPTASALSAVLDDARPAARRHAALSRAPPVS